MDLYEDKSTIFQYFARLNFETPDVSASMMKMMTVTWCHWPNLPIRFGLVLWHIHHCRLFDAKSILFIKTLLFQTFLFRISIFLCLELFWILDVSELAWKKICVQSRYFLKEKFFVKHRIMQVQYYSYTIDLDYKNLSFFLLNRKFIM